MISRCGILLLLLGLSAGCVQMPLSPAPKPPPPAAPVRKPALSAPDVLPEEVTENNAREKATALEREMDRDAESESSTSAGVTGR